MDRVERPAPRARLSRSRSHVAGIVSAALEGHGDGTASAEERMNGATQLAKLRMEKRLAFLGTLGSNAPFIGLLGTVIGRHGISAIDVSPEGRLFARHPGVRPVAHL